MGWGSTSATQTRGRPAVFLMRCFLQPSCTTCSKEKNPRSLWRVQNWIIFSPTHGLSFLTVPAAPTNLSLTNPGSSSELHAWWNKPVGGRDHYRVVLHSLTLSRDRVQTVSQDAQNISWTHLEAGSRFAVRVIAVKGSLEASSANVTQWTCESEGLRCAPEPPWEPHRVPTTTFPIPNTLSMLSPLPHPAAGRGDIVPGPCAQTPCFPPVGTLVSVLTPLARRS